MEKKSYIELVASPSSLGELVKKFLHLGLVAAVPLITKAFIANVLENKLYTALSIYPNRFTYAFFEEYCKPLFRFNFRIKSSLVVLDPELHNEIEHEGEWVFLSRNNNIVIMTERKTSPTKEGIRETLIEPKMFIIGPNHKKDLELLRRLEKKHRPKTSRTSLRFYSLKNKGYISSVLKKPNEIFSDQLNPILKKVDSLLYRFKVSNRFNIQSSSSIILYGKPGTGKNTITNAIINHIQRSKIYPFCLHVTSCDITSNDLSYMYNKNDTKGNVLIDLVSECTNVSVYQSYIGTNPNDISSETTTVLILIIHDCDLLMKPRSEDNNNGSINITHDIKNILDNGIPKHDGPILLIMTTNYIDRIDPCILRAMRTDICEEITDITLPTAERMCKHYNVAFSEIASQYPEIVQSEEQLVNPAQLQQKIIEELYKREIR